MRCLHADNYPVLECKDASLASQSEKSSTLITEILKRFTATGIMPNAHSPEEAIDPMAYPESFVDGMNALTERKGVYDDEGVSLADGLERDFKNASESVSSGKEGKDEGAITPPSAGTDGNPVSAGKENGE